MSGKTYDVLVVGEGISGLTAAHALAQRGLAVATLEAQLFGGLVINVNELEPAPDGRKISGAEFASELMEANAGLGVTSIQAAVTKLADGGGIKRLETGASTCEARQVVLASGARLRKLNVPGEAEFEGRGVSQCADCDGPMYHDERAVVVGGGDSALQEALVLAHFCSKVYIIHRGRQFRARQHFVDQVLASDRISVLWNAAVEEISGGKMVEWARIRHTDGRMEELPCAGVFAYVGLMPNADYLPPEIRHDEAGFVVTGDTLESTLPGVWAVGALRHGYSGLLSDAIAEARRASEAIVARLT
ncbi:MAG: NAD(P)/FAD-dependent oxidoreductase [Betaproteobacteria bacterium]|nr:NAD(P)/FAD-dependent oxidoreductase [Betaproteobacteria bacterium]